jgi:hypothetical protein
VFDPISMIVTSAALAVGGAILRASDNRALEAQRQRDHRARNVERARQVNERRAAIQREVQADFGLRLELHQAQWGYSVIAEEIEKEANRQQNYFVTRAYR